MAAMAKVMLGELLVGAGLVTEEQVLAALRGQRGSGLALGHYLVRSGVLGEDDLVRALSEQLGIPVVFLEGLMVHDDALRKVPEDFCRANLIVPFKLEGRTLHVATADPTRDELLDQLRISTHCDVRFSMAAPSSIDKALERAFSVRSGAASSVPAKSSASKPAKGQASPLPAGIAAVAAVATDRQDDAISSIEQRLIGLEAIVSKVVAVLEKHSLATSEDLLPSAAALTGLRR
jgi:Type II secretion system (T2SS), protein E, N-terminal domain